MKIFISIFAVVSALALPARQSVSGGLPSSPYLDAKPHRIDVVPGSSLTALRDRVRALSPELRRHGVDVVFASGTYSLRTTLELSSVDGGTAAGPIRWRAGKGEKVVFTTGVRIDGAVPVKENDVNAGRIDSSVKSRVLVVDLKDVDVEYWHDLKSACFTPPLPDLTVDGEAYHPAEWPNGTTNWATIAAFRDSGRFVDSDDNVHYFQRRILTDEKGRESWTRGPDDLPSGGLFRYAGDRPLRWLRSPETWLNGFWAYDWHSGIIPIASIDPSRCEIRLAFNYHYGVRQGNQKPRRWKALHVLEELDEPGEYFVDRWNRRLYFLPLKPVGDASSIVLVSGAKPMIVMKDVKNLSFEGFEVTAAKEDAIRGEHLQGVALKGMKFHDVALLAVNFNDAKDCRIVGCDFIRTGTGSIWISGGDRKTLAPGNNLIEDCLFRDYSLLKKSQGYALQTYGVGNVARHCFFAGGGHQTTYTCGNDNVIEYCVISNCVNATADAGACYQGRNPSGRGNVIRNCLFTDVGNSSQGGGTCCIYYDDGDGGNLVAGCIFENCGILTPKGTGYGAVFSHGGHSNRVVNCEFRNCSRPFGSAPWKQSKWTAFVNGPLMKKRMTEEVDVREEPYRSHYPDLRDFFKPEADEVRWNLAERNLIVDCGEPSGRWTTNGNASVVGEIRDFKPIPRERIGLLTRR